MVPGALLAAALSVTPVYIAGGEPAGRSTIVADLDLGFPFTTLWVTYGVSDSVDVGIRAADVTFNTNEIGLIVRAELWHRERLRLAARIWGSWGYSADPVGGQLLAANGPLGLAGMLVLSGHREEGGLGFYVAIGARAAFRPFVLCYSCETAPDLVPGRGVGWRLPGLIGFELPVYSTIALHLEVGAELRLNFPDGAVPVFPMPTIDGGISWRW